MRLIDADALVEEIKSSFCKACIKYCRSCDIDDFISYIDDAPTIDAAPVVRCKDCKHGLMVDISDRKTHGTILEAVYCERFEMGCSIDDYCSTGARMDGEKEWKKQ